MANTDKNILITPNIGSSTDDPNIVFSGADSSTTAQNITLRVYPTNSGTLSFEGSAGQLFSITNNLSGTIYSVNDVSGIPSIEVLDDGTIKLAEYSGNTLIGTGTDNGTDKLQLAGTMSVNTDGYITFGPNSTWASSLRVGGNGRTATGTEMASVVTTDGNLHLDAAQSSNATYLNYYAGSSGVAFGNGASGIVAWMGPDGDLWKGSSDNSGSQYWHAGNLSAVTTTYNSTLNSDSRNSRGVTRLYRRDDNSDYSVQTYWTGSRWYISGYSGDTFHAEAQVGYATSAGSATSATSASSASGVTHNASRTDSTAYPVGWFSSTTSPAYSCAAVTIQSSTGTLNATNVNTTSDANKKQNVKTITNALDKVKKLRGVTFNWIDSNIEGIGVIAQEIEQVIPQVVNTNVEDGTKSVSYGNLVGLLIEAVKEQQDHINKQYKEIEELKSLVQKLLD